MLTQALKWQLNMGANFLPAGGAEFRVWAPKAQSVAVVPAAEDSKIQYPMQRREHGIFELTVPELLHDMDYFYCIDHDKLRPDPVSRWQPKGVHGPSRLWHNLAFKWHDQEWRGIPLTQYLIYELHVGTFTPEGTFEAAIDKLPYLKKLGVSAIELMPIIEFPGDRNWGYDGTYPYAPHHSYGGPIGLKRLVDACHQAGLVVVLDVVYNHLGPEGNYLNEFGYYFTDRYKTPWGEAVNYDGPYCDAVRRYFIDNALYWLNEYHIDALRLDAIHAIFDFSPRHILEQIREEFHLHAEKLGREAYIFAESDLNDVRIVLSQEKGGYAIDAVWSDDFHHSIIAKLTRSKWGYLNDFGELAQVAKALKEGYVYDGRWSAFRKKIFGSSTKDISGFRFVACIQNHDQISNAFRGQRLSQVANLEKFTLASMILFCCPNIPLLFMGQEWGAEAPFFYFTSFEDEKLAESVREGYCKEFFLEESQGIDPQDPQRFLDSKLDWDQLNQPEHEEMRRYYHDLIQLRQDLPCLKNYRKDLCHIEFNENEEWLVLERGDPSGSKAIVVANFADHEQDVPVLFTPGQWSLRLSSAFDREFLSSQLAIQKEQKQSICIPKWTASLYVLT